MTTSGSTPIDLRERNELCALLSELGPEAPTLCAGWTTADLAAHLVLREHFRRWDDPRRARALAGGYEDVLSRLRAGPPLLPWRVPGLRTLTNGFEYFVHHEDVRRANGRGPRQPDSRLEELAWWSSTLLGWRLARHLRPVTLELLTPDGRRRRFGHGSTEETAVLEGRPTELALYLAGRREAAVVELRGPDHARAAVEASESRL